MAAKHPIDGRAAIPSRQAEPVGTLTVAPPSGQHPTDLLGREGMGAAMRPRGQVGQPGLTMLAGAASHG